MNSPRKKIRLDDKELESQTKSDSRSPLVKRPKLNKLKITAKEMSPSDKKSCSSKSYDRSQDLYRKICQGLINSSRTPPKANSQTTSKFFKSRTPSRASNLPPRTRAVGKKTVTLYFSNEPVEYIKDLEKVKTVKRGKKKRDSEVLEIVMPLYNIRAADEAPEYLETVSNIVEEIFETSINMILKKRKYPIVNKNKIILKSIKRPRKAGDINRSTSCSSKPLAISFGDNMEDIKDMETMQKDNIAFNVTKENSKSDKRKRKSSVNLNKPSKKRKTIVYNNHDSSDDDDEIFLSTCKPILSEEEKQEMEQILGKSNETEKLLGDDNACPAMVAHQEVDMKNKKLKSTKEAVKEVELEEIPYSFGKC